MQYLIKNLKEIECSHFMRPLGTIAYALDKLLSFSFLSLTSFSHGTLHLRFGIISLQWTLEMYYTKFYNSILISTYPHTLKITVDRFFIISHNFANKPSFENIMVVKKLRISIMLIIASLNTACKVPFVVLQAMLKE